MTEHSDIAKSDERRSEILDRLADYILADGLEAASLRPLAKAAGTSDRMLLYYFNDKPEIIAATLERISERLVAHLDANTVETPLPFDALLARLLPVLMDDALWPFMCLWLEIASRSARRDPLYRAVGEEIGRGFLEWGAAQLDSPTEAARAVEAARLLVMIEGRVLLKSIGMDDVNEAAT